MPSDADALEEVLNALTRTVSRGTARIAFHVELSDGLDDMPKSGVSPRPEGSALQRPRQRLSQQPGRLCSWVLLRFARRLLNKISPIYAVGIIDFAEHRCLYHPAGKARVMMVVGDRSWEGTPGTAVAGLSATPASPFQPLWVFDLVRGVTEAQPIGDAELSGRRCRGFFARADLNRAADAASYDVAVPVKVNQIGELKRIPMTVWVDDEGYIRRIWQSNPTSRLELIEFGIAAPSDWSVLHGIATKEPPQRCARHDV